MAEESPTHNPNKNVLSSFLSVQIFAGFPSGRRKSCKKPNKKVFSFDLSVLIFVDFYNGRRKSYKHPNKGVQL
jgi:hypothetical protein